MAKGTGYLARQADEQGYIDYPSSEHQIWHKLITHQKKLLPGKACDEYIAGLKLLALPEDQIPQLPSIDAILQPATGWRVAQVAALISFDKFFSLLANKEFPVATFIRSQEELEYLQEPDIFHEIYGHCPLLTNEAFAHFTHQYGQLGAKASKEDRVYLARLYWFTVEFGLLRHKEDLRIYGGGILSSPGETELALQGDKVEHRAFDIVDLMRTPYRIDIMQPIYYVIDGIDQLFEIANMDIMGAVKNAKRLGLFEPTFPPREQQTG
ncbi:phenylalanine 4-monooxygenase [Aestuariirhabdus sp. Z084]|uniref:phenylalanine 4-monooxygenase n=1 Tax=Aestuariirhabdus haliotis TaxID=2918751 RepID=UPI00201B3854|nr:phenylalanine 4-monooxygenase [Aestuariirhabdus haliotis]MCL6417713.1 phenylalanine 4-monooxygenase [Aestuariirhabdus haliotis]MCL6421656.1 phenylalanine 4-monooxygenase [Aestuariirhabdus haliotis]